MGSTEGEHMRGDRCWICYLVKKWDYNISGELQVIQLSYKWNSPALFACRLIIYFTMVESFYILPALNPTGKKNMLSKSGSQLSKKYQTMRLIFKFYDYVI